MRGRTAAQIHALGRAEVARLREEIGGIAKEVGFNGTTDAFIEHLRTDKRYFFGNIHDLTARRTSEAESVREWTLFFALRQLRRCEGTRDEP